MSPVGSRGHRGGSRNLGVSGHAAVPCVRLRDSTGPDAFFFNIACGVVGSLVDSVLGVVMQAKYRCPNDAEGGLVETPPCGAQAALVSGYAWVTNDAVNLMSGIAVVLLGLLVVV